MMMRCKIGTRGGPTVSAPLCACLVAVLLAGSAAGRDTHESERHPDAPGVIRIEGAGDGAALSPVVDPETGVRSWSWAWGALTVTSDSLAVNVDAPDLSLPYGTDLGGVSRGRRLRFVPGTYPVDGPLLLSGHGFQLYVGRGVLEIAADRLVLADRKPAKPPAAQYLLFTGILLVTMFMMMKTRKRLKRS
jgi:hypothetical protein